MGNKMELDSCREMRDEKREGWTTEKPKWRVMREKTEVESRQLSREKLPDVGNSWQRRREAGRIRSGERSQ